MNEQSVILPDGRTLAWREYGDPAGYPVVNNHGGLVCGLDISPADEVARELGMRIISPDRPGVGDSSLLTDRRTGDWPADVAELLAHLEIEHCAAFGWSLGSEYALSLGAAGIADRVAVVGGVPPMKPEDLAALNRTDQVLAKLSVERPGVAEAVFTTMRVGTPLLAFFASRTSGGPDNRVLAELSDFPQWTRQALLQPRGMVEEYRAMCEPWGFTPADVRCPVHVWQGTLDEFVPVRLALELVAALPDVTYDEVPEAGHFLAYERWREVLEPLTG